jgi:Holliday junction resolvasome RuvABC endonuclease subunit
MIVLGIDPSLQATGIAVIETNGVPGKEKLIAWNVIRTTHDDGDDLRCRRVALTVYDYAVQLQVEAVGIETQFSSEKNRQVGIRLGRLRGAVQQQLAQRFPPSQIIDVNPAQRLVALGIRQQHETRELKRLAVEAVQRRYGELIDHNAADAVGIALVADRIYRRGPLPVQTKMRLRK